MAHSPHANILEHARLSLAPGHVARRADAYLIALASRSATMKTWENHAIAIPQLTTPLSPTGALLVADNCGAVAVDAAGYAR